MITRVAGVCDDEFDDVFARLDCARNVEREGNVTADMVADRNAVEFDGANHIHRVEVQNRHCFDETLVKIEGAVIIKCVVGRDSRALGKSRKQTLGRKRNEDFALIFSAETFTLAQNGIVPFAVERDVTVSCKLGTRIFRKRC